MLWLAVAAGAAVGAPTRFAIDRVTLARFGKRWPYGTFVVNSVGSFILGVVTGLIAGSATGDSAGWKLVSALVGTGFCGALTTFGGWSSQIIELSRGPSVWRGTAYAAVSIAVGLTLASVGYVFGFGITGH